MEKDLRQMNEKMKHLQNQVQQVRAKFDYQMKGSDAAGSASSVSPTKASNPALVQNFKDILLEE